MKPANRGAREVPEHNVTTMMKAKDTAPAPRRRATEKPKHGIPKTPRRGQGQDLSVQSDRKHARRMSRGAPPSPTGSEEPERHPWKGDNWTGPPQPKSVREKRKSPGERENLALQNKHLKDREPSGKGRDGQNRPGVRGKTMVRVRDVARSNARTAMPEPEITTTPSGEK